MSISTETQKKRTRTGFFTQAAIHLSVIGVVFFTLLFWQTAFHAGRIALGAWSTLFLPGYLLTLILWRYEEQRMAIRCSLSTVLSLPLIALPILLVSKTGMAFSATSILITVLIVNCALLLLALAKNRRFSRTATSTQPSFSPRSRP